MKGKVKMNRSEIWEVPSEKSLVRSIAAYKANQTRLVNKAKTKKEKAQIMAQYEQKIATATDEFHRFVRDAKRHNAAVKANQTRSKSATRTTSSRSKKCSCMSVSTRTKKSK